MRTVWREARLAETDLSTTSTRGVFRRRGVLQRAGVFPDITQTGSIVMSTKTTWIMRLAAIGRVS